MEILDETTEVWPVAVGQIYRHVATGSIQRIVHLDTFDPPEGTPQEALSGRPLLAADSGVTAILECDVGIKAGDKLVVHASAVNSNGKVRVRPLSEFEDGRFVLVENQQE